LKHIFLCENSLTHPKVVFDAYLVEASWQQAMCHLPVVVTGAAGEQTVA
jgi:hypothetical protein